MKISVVKFDITNELDIVLAHKRASQICDLTGIGISGRTSFVTAISEICRNCLEHAGSGQIVFSIDDISYVLEAAITDKGPGIYNVESVLNRSASPGSKGCGIQYSRKLVDFFEINTSPDGTSVSLGVKIISKSIPINRMVINGWVQHFENEKPVSPYEEIKRQNMQLLEISNQLKLKNLETAEQLEQIKDLNNQLSIKNKELEDFAYAISHDLKNPINNLKLLVSIVENTTNPDQKNGYIREFKKLTSRLDHMLSGLIEIMDVKNNQENAAKAIAFEDILRVAEEELSQLLRETQGSITFNFEAFPAIVYYEVFLHSIFLNLISNALKYRDENRLPLIEISSAREGDFAVLKISDNGVGMNMAAVSKSLFKPFRRFSKDVEGKGIGLHLVKSMVEKNGGRIEVESEPGKGTTFKLYLKEQEVQVEV